MKIEKSRFCTTVRFLFLVPGAGIEPARPYRREILSLQCLPVSPSGQRGEILAQVMRITPSCACAVPVGEGHGHVLDVFRAPLGGDRQGNSGVAYCAGMRCHHDAALSAKVVRKVQAGASPLDEKSCLMASCLPVAWRGACTDNDVATRYQQARSRVEYSLLQIRNLHFYHVNLIRKYAAR